MRLNDGMPVWHASVSAWSPRPLRMVLVPQLVEAEAIRCVEGVGGDREWWIHTRMGHLRVAVTPEEFAAIPCGIAEHDAGDSGPERPRTRR